MENTTARKTIEEAFPELDLISNDNFRNAVIEIWEEAFAETDWTDLNDVPKSGEVVEYSNLQHTRSVTLQAIACADVIEKIHGIEVNRNILITAALLHDLTKLYEYKENGEKTDYGKLIQHGVFSASKAEKRGLPLEVQHAIITHTGLSRIVPQTIEAIILHYVDFLDSDVLLKVLDKPLFLKK